MNKKTLILIAVVITLILAGVGTYLFISKKTPASPTQIGEFPAESNQQIVNTPSTNNTAGTPFVPGSGATLPRLYELHKAPVAGVGFIEYGKGLSRIVSARYIERALGHIYETQLATLTGTRISNETHSRLSEAFWGNGGKGVVIRSFSEAEGSIRTRILNLGGSATSPTPASDFIQTEEVFLPDYIPFLAIAEDGTDKIFYLQNGDTSSAGLTTNFRGVSTTIFNSTFTEWLPQFPNQKLVTLNTKPSAGVPGHLFFLDTKTKALTKVLGDINGLTTLTSRDGKSVLYAETKNGSPELSVYNVAKKEVLPLFMQTLPEKCAWSIKEPFIVYCAVPQAIPSGQYPDQWYQGVVSFSDSIWKINTVTSVAEKIYDLPSLDVINPTLSSDDAYFLFMNKITGTPWVYRIADATPTTATVPALTNVTEGMVKVR